MNEHTILNKKSFKGRKKNVEEEGEDVEVSSSIHEFQHELGKDTNSEQFDAVHNGSRKIVRSIKNNEAIEDTILSEENLNDNQNYQKADLKLKNDHINTKYFEEKRIDTKMNTNDIDLDHIEEIKDKCTIKDSIKEKENDDIIIKENTRNEEIKPNNTININENSRKNQKQILNNDKEYVVDNKDYDFHRVVFHNYFPLILGAIGIIAGTLLVLNGSNN